MSSKYRTAFLSGFRFNCPVSFPKIEMEGIDIGDSNNITGFATGINIGSRNFISSSNSKEIYFTIGLTGITGLGAGQTPFTGVTGTALQLVGFREVDECLNLGFSNNADSSNQAYNIGALNSSASSSNLFQVGLNLSSSNLINSTIIGNNNYLLSGEKVLVFGNDNQVYSADELKLIGLNNYAFGYNGNVIGKNNTLTQGVSSKVNILGDGNILRNSLGLEIFGSVNVFSGIENGLIVGLNNSANSTGNFKNSNLLILGKNNQVLNSNNEILVGESNKVKDANNNITIGKNIDLFGNNNLCFGKENTMHGFDDSIYGKLNVSNSSQNNSVFGSSNSLSGANSNTIIGSSNSSNADLLNLLYLQGLTGVTGLGAGQTPFTGVTGYRLGGGYTGIEIVGGNHNFFVGNSNQSTLNTSSYVFGKNNQLLDTQDAYIIGGSNFLEKSINSYIFGQDNNVSGDQNYVIGNNNTLGTGDYNSIFIGISHISTGKNKVSTISLASIDNKIEISPSEIRIDSINRPKINGQNIIIQSEFDTLADSLKQNGPTFTTNTFQDPYYDKLADKILLSGFTYNSGASTSLVSPSIRFRATSTLSLNKFNILSTTSYTGARGFNVIYGNHKNPKFSPAWLVVDNSTSGVYYKNDITPLNITPQSGWYTTGFRDNGLLYTGTSGNFGINLVMDSRSGYMSVKTSSFGTMYIPVFY